MKHTNPVHKGSASNKKGNTISSAGKAPAKKEQSSKDKGKGNKYKMDFIKKDNFDTMGSKFNITEIKDSLKTTVL